MKALFEKRIRLIDPTALKTSWGEIMLTSVVESKIYILGILVIRWCRFSRNCGY